MNRGTRIRLINETLAEYYKTHSDKVPALDFMGRFVKRGIYNKDTDIPGSPLRKLLRKLDSEHRLNDIPYLIAERKPSITKWYFAPVGGVVGKITKQHKDAVKKTFIASAADNDFKEGLAP